MSEVSSNENRSLLQRLHDSARVSAESSRRHDGYIGEMFSAMAGIFEEAAREIERLISIQQDFHNLDDVGEIRRLREILRKAGVTGAPGPTGEWLPDGEQSAYPHAYANTPVFGLTKRELFAAMALQGVASGAIASRDPELRSYHAMAKDAVYLADELLAALREV